MMGVRKSGKAGKRLVAAMVAAVLSLAVAAPGMSGQKSVFAEETASAPEGSALSYRPVSAGSEPFYSEAVDLWRKNDLRDGNAELEWNASQYSAVSAAGDASIVSYDGQSNVLLWSNPRGWLEYRTEMPQEGLYELQLHYTAVSGAKAGSHSQVLLAVQVNGEYPFSEAHSVRLDQSFREKRPFKFAKDGNQIRSSVEEITGWRVQSLRDSDGAYSQPLLWHFKKGANVIRLEAASQALVLKSITISPRNNPPAYRKVKQGNSAAGSQSVNPIIIEGEDFSSKNAESVQPVYDRDPMTTPKSLALIKYNTMGGWTWYKGGQSVTWDFDVPEDGVYKIAVRAEQNFRKNLPVFRTVYVDGVVPFRELISYKFSYGSGWRGYVIGESDDKPYEFSLVKGRHSLTLAATYEPYMPIVSEIDRIAEELKQISTDIRTVTGNREDQYRVWDVEKDLPGMTGRLRAVKDRFDRLSDQMVRINGATDNVSQTFKSNAKDLEAMLRHPDSIPSSQLDLGIVQEKMETQRKDLMEAPLQIDKIVVAHRDAKFPVMKANWRQQLSGSFQSLIHSFDNRQRLKASGDDVLNVWMMWGRDYVDELQRMADEQFTPKYGMKVRINLVQTPDMLILGHAAGILPDVALGVPSNTPFELAVRHAALDLSKLPGADTVIQRYAPGALLPYYYEGGYYAFPETMNFKVLFYRKDILKQLKLPVPDTWDDVYNLVPTLLQNQSNFYMDPSDFSYLFFQNGAEIFKQDGLSTALDQPVAFRSFQQWTDLYNMQGLEEQVQSFYNQFRRGTLPIGISDFNQYMQLLVAAPDIRDEWAIAPLPGTRGPDGTVSRWVGGLQSTSSMMFNSSSTAKQDMAWKFLQWYLSDDVQTDFGLQLEQYSGDTFRWNSANVAAFSRMPWKREDLNVILQQWKWTKEMPNVPGGYITARELGFAWNRAVIDGEPSRISLEKAVQNINRELHRKQLEFHLIDSAGRVLHSLNLPRITTPWKGAEKYVE